MAANGTRENAFPGPREDPAERTFLGGSSMGARSGWFFVFALIATAIAGGVLYLADRQAERAFDGFAVAADVSRAIDRIDDGAAALGAEARIYVESREPRAAESYRGRSEALLARIRELIDNPAAIDAQRLATTLNDGVSQHAEQFQSVARIVGLMGGANAGLIGNARSSGAALERRVAETAPSFAQSVAALRRVEAAIVAGGAAPADKTLTEEIDQFRRAVGASSLDPAVKREIDRLAEAYAADLGQLARIRAALTSAIVRLDEIEGYIAPSVEALDTYAAELADAQRRAAAEAQRRLRLVVGGGVAGALALLLFAGLVLIRSLTRPVLRLARAAAELAHGNHAAAIPALGNDDATGAIARSLTYFRENLIQADRLRKELELHLQRADAAADSAALADLPDPEPSAAESPLPAEAGPSQGRALVPAQPDRETGTQISIISRMLAQTSQAASSAAGEAERTETMVTGLADAIQRIDDIETLLASISDQMSLLAVQTALSDEMGDDRENLVVLAEKRQGEGGHRNIGQSAGDRIETIQAGTKRAIKAVQHVGRAISDVNEVAVQFAADASSEALDAATELLRQSEDLRGMLDDLLTKIRAEGGSAPQFARERQTD